MQKTGRQKASAYKSAEYYLDRIPDLNADQERLRNRLKGIFQHGKEGNELIQRIKAELTEALIVSVEVVSNCKVYRFL